MIFPESMIQVLDNFQFDVREMNSRKETPRFEEEGHFENKPSIEAKL
ncbi:MAG: hypothetical protein ACXQS8_00920 [Candidatus Helarchaeales archaeon]